MSLQELKQLKQKWEDSLKLLKSINYPTGAEKLLAADNQKTQNALQSINHRIQQEKEASQYLQAAQEIEKLALQREALVQNVDDFNLVDITWDRAIKNLQEISPLTSSYKPSRRLLKTYLFHKRKIEKRKKQEESAVKLHSQAKKYVELAKKHEEKKQWKNSVNAWGKAIYYLNKIPKNTFQWNKIQPLISTYNLSLNQAENQLKYSIKYQKIISDLNAMCLNKQKICQYEIKENLIQMRLESHYLEQLWNLALQAKVQANVKVQVDILNHLATFEHRLQNISHQTGKSIEVYNSQGNLMTVYHR